MRRPKGRNCGLFPGTRLRVAQSCFVEQCDGQTSVKECDLNVSVNISVGESKT